MEEGKVSIRFLKYLVCKLKEIIVLFSHIFLFDPLVLITLLKSDEIIVVTDDSKSLLPNFVQKKQSLPAIIDAKNYKTFSKY